MSKRKPMSEETKRKIAEANRGKHHSEETGRRISESNKGKVKHTQKQSNSSKKLIRESILQQQLEDSKVIFNISYWEQYGISSYDNVSEYLDFIKSIQSLGDRDLEYCEHHHIVPKSVDSRLSKNKYNIIRLTAKEHFIAHQLLCEIFTGDLKCKMTLALNLMMHPNATTKYIPDADTYEKIRLESRKSQSRLFSGENNPFYGHKHSEESRKKISESSKNQVPWNKGMEMSDEYKRKVSECAIGKKIPNRSKNSSSPGTIWITNDITSKRIHPDELDRYILEGWRKGKQYHEKNPIIRTRSKEASDKASKSMVGRKFINDGSINKLVKSDEIDTYLNSGWNYGRLAKQT